MTRLKQRGPRPENEAPASPPKNQPPSRAGGTPGTRAQGSDRGQAVMRSSARRTTRFDSKSALGWAGIVVQSSSSLFFEKSASENFRDFVEPKGIEPSTSR